MLTVLGSSIGAEETVTDKIRLAPRTRIETADGSGRYHAVASRAEWDPAKTAIVICDMWDKHWCKGATRRVGEMAPRVNEVISKARDQGVFIIHAPSNTLDHYKDAPARKRALAAPKAPARVKLQKWCKLDPAREPSLPIDDSDGGCDCLPQCKGHQAWSKQIDTIEIHDEDAITDSVEAYYLLEERGIDNVLVMGVHTNMCVLGRPFSIRQMVNQGKNVVLMRDLTDTMYNSRMRPFVDHHTGTDLVVAHIEKHWVPTITSDQIVGGKPFRFERDRRKHLVIVMSEDEYETHETLPRFARKHLGKDFRVSYVFGSERKGKNELHNMPGIEVLDEADLAFFSIRRRTPPQAQMDVIRRFVGAGKPLVAIRTSSHAFDLRSSPPPEGHAAWPEFDPDVLGGNYQGHHNNKPKKNKPGNNKEDPPTYVQAVATLKGHPILRGVRTEEFIVPSWLYKTRPLAATAQTLIMGRAGDRQPHEPVAWTNLRPGGGRVFYTSLGHPDDFKIADFERLLLNGIHWAAETTADAKSAKAQNSENR